MKKALLLALLASAFHVSAHPADSNSQNIIFLANQDNAKIGFFGESGINIGYDSKFHEIYVTNTTSKKVELFWHCRYNNENYQAMLEFYQPSGSYNIPLDLKQGQKYYIHPGSTEPRENYEMVNANDSLICDDATVLVADGTYKTTYGANFNFSVIGSGYNRFLEADLKTDYPGA